MPIAINEIVLFCMGIRTVLDKERLWENDTN